MVDRLCLIDVPKITRSLTIYCQSFVRNIIIKSNRFAAKRMNKVYFSVKGRLRRRSILDIMPITEAEGFVHDSSV